MPRLGPWLEDRLERERDQLFLWSPVALGIGIGAWFALDTRAAWLAWLLACAAVAMLGLVAGRGTRLRRSLLWGGVLAAIGCGWAWWRAELAATPVLARPMVVEFVARVERVEPLPARELVRVTAAPSVGQNLPPRVRVSINQDRAPKGLQAGDVVRLRARLIGPQPPPVPGGFDFARNAWFARLGAVGKAIGPVGIVEHGARGGEGLRERLSRHVRAQVPGSAGGIAAAFATGDRGGIAPEDEDAMRAAGLTHLLSISGLHVTAVVGATMILTLRLLALSPWLALRWPLVTVSAGMGALAGVAYTLLTGAEVPTIRSCVAALLVVGGIALGREAFTLRLVAAGALFVLALWPESLVGPSFQLSFAAIATIVALHEASTVKRWFGKRDEGIFRKFAREGGSLLLTGIAVEVALAPIALFHFHKSGLYGAFANIVAIPLTTFVTMPLEALALLFDLVGLGGPFWWATGLSLELLLALARRVAAIPGAQSALADVPVPAFAAIVLGGTWLLLWKTRWRLLGIAPVLLGSGLALAAPPPDLVVTGDGKHMLVRGANGLLATLRPRAGDYVRSVLAERGGSLAELYDLDDLPEAGCSADLCRVTLQRGADSWTVMATRSPYFVDRPLFEAQCRDADIIVSDRRLPAWCRPRWFRADAALLRRTGGIAVTLSSGEIATVAQARGRDHPWVQASNVAAAPPAGPARAPGPRGNAAHDDWRLRDRAVPSRPRGGSI